MSAASQQNAPTDLPRRPQADRPLQWVRTALIAYWVALAIATHIPPLQPPTELPHSDKVAHVLSYALLASLLGLAWGREPLSARRVWISVGVIASYAAVDELTQPLVGRTADLWDWVADLCGGLLGLSVAWVLTRRGRFAGNPVFDAGVRRR